MKRNWKKILGFAILLAVLFLAACGSGEEEDSASEGEGDASTEESADGGEESSDGEASGEPIEVVTTIAQIGQPIEEIGGDMVNVESLMGPSVDPHLYDPTESDISKLQEADVVLYSGLDLEANMVEPLESIGEEKPVLAISDTLPEDELLEDEEGAVDPHVWFDYNLWEQALDAGVEELKEYAPENADQLEENKQAYFAQFDELETEAEKLQDIPEEQRYLVTAHDAFSYFGRMNDIEVVGLQGISTEDEAGVSDVNDTITTIVDHNVPAIFVESSVNQDTINAVIEGAGEQDVDVEIGGELFSDAMGEEGTEEGTYIGMYEHNINTIYDALSGGDE